MKQASSRTVIVAGFLAMIALQACVMWVWHISEDQHVQRLSRIANEQHEQQLIFAIRDAAHKRALSLFRMAELEDQFDRDREYMQFEQYANDFVQARDELVAYQESSKRQNDHEQPLWGSVRAAVAQAAKVQGQVAEMLRTGRDSQAHQLLRYSVITAQESVMNSLTAMLDAADDAVQQDLEREKVSSNSMSVLVFTFAGGALFVAIAIGVYVMVRTGRAERVLVDQSEHMEKLKDLAESSSRAKSAFLANMSHEIRTPLTAIIGFSELLLDTNTSPADRLSATQTVIRCGKHLLQVINDILDMSKVEAEKLQIETLAVDVFQVVDDVRSLASVQASGKGIAYNVDYQFPLPSTIESDPVRIKQVLFNLVSNAIKFTHSGGVRVRISYITEPNLLRFDVIDTGIGLSDAQKQNLFKAFGQADASTTRKFGGTGLGLHLSRTLCRKLGGDIIVESAEDVGSIFTATVSAGLSAQKNMVTQIPRAAEKAPHIQEQAKRCGSVLLVDDVDENRQLISLYLRRLGATVTCVENGLHAVSSALSGEFDLILMDKQMPVMDGLEATALLRSRGYSKPIIALTANVMKDEVEECIKSGCDGFLGKPVDLPVFVATVTRYLKPTEVSNAAISQYQAPMLRSVLLDREPELADLIDKYLHELPRKVEQLTALCRSKNWVELKQKLHDFKSTSGNYGFPQLSKLASQAEKEINSERYAELGVLIEQIADMAERASPQQIESPVYVASTN